VKYLGLHFKDLVVEDRTEVIPIDNRSYFNAIRSDVYSCNLICSILERIRSVGVLGLYREQRTYYGSNFFRANVLANQIRRATVVAGAIRVVVGRRCHRPFAIRHGAKLAFGRTPRLVLLHTFVPFQSYYVFNVLCVTPRSDKSVLITSGLHPISRAAIAVALAEKRDTYATVESNQRADQLSRIFPTVISVSAGDGSVDN